MKHFEEIKTLLDCSSLFYMISVGMDGRYTYINSHYAQQFAYINRSFVGQSYDISMHPDDAASCMTVSQQCFANPGQLFPNTIRKHDGKGGYIHTQWEYKAMFEDGVPVGIFCVGYNITQLVENKQHLSNANETLEKNSLTLKQIAFKQSHLIRAPLANILGLAALLEDSSPEGSEAHTLCKLMLESAMQLDKVITSIVLITQD